MGFYIAVMLGAVIVGVVSFFLTKDTYGYMATYGCGKKEIMQEVTDGNERR